MESAYLNIYIYIRGERKRKKKTKTELFPIKLIKIPMLTSNKYCIFDPHIENLKNY